MPHSLPLPCLLLSRLFFPPLHQVGDMVTGLRGLKSRLLEMREYLEAVAAGRLPVNHDIMRNMQVCVWCVVVAGGWGQAPAFNFLRYSSFLRCVP